MKIRDVEVAVLAAPGDYGIVADGSDSAGPLENEKGASS